MSREKISACIITYNEEAKIRRCLDSVSWCDEIVVLDSFSTDHTLDICREFTDRVFQRSWNGYIEARNTIRDMAEHGWVLFLDADEEVSLEMRDQILREFREGPGKYVGFQFPRQVYYLGRWIRHGEWNPDVKLRLFCKDKGHSGGVEPHDMVIVEGPVRTLSGSIYHFTYDSISHHITQVNRFSLLSAESKYNAGQRFRWIDFLFRPPFRIFKGLILKGGIFDGLRGIIIAFICAFGVSVKYAKLWELQNEKRLKGRALHPDSDDPD